MSSNFAVLGSPIGHSLSPALHSAVITRLGIDATYDKFEVVEEEFPAFLESHSFWEGFSLTMPLKRVARQLVVSECSVSSLTGAVNTIVRRPEGWFGFNTDVWGAQQALSSQLDTVGDSAILIGAGATAQSLLVALHGIGVTEFTFLVRDASRTTDVTEVASRLGVTPRVERLGATVAADIVVNTLPSSAVLDDETIEAIDGSALFDVTYDPWPTVLATEWTARGLPVVSGKWMLLWQAVRQSRLFYGGDVEDELPDESTIVTAMRSAVGL